MHAHRTIARLGALAVSLCVAAADLAPAQVIEQERNLWPVMVTERVERSVSAEPGRRSEDSARLGGDSSPNPEAKSDIAPLPQWTAAGPLLFGKMMPDGTSTQGFRPLWVQQKDAQGRFRAGFLLYPLFSYRTDEATYQWNLLELIRRTGRHANAPARTSRYEPGGDFEVWPFWFSRQTGDPALSYRALFPVAGTIKNKLGFDQATWFIFPLYSRTEKKGVVTTSTPWPIVRTTRGQAHGFGLWPLFENRERPGVYEYHTFLWPLGYNNTIQPGPGAAPGTAAKRQIGFLPFYARHTGPGYVDENFGWPFFGYTDRTQPTAYHETRYFWPLLVQGRGDHFVNRWGPFYTHSIRKGYDKTWYAWPVVRHATWEDRGLAMEKTQVLYFLYWNETERSARNPAKPAASLTHLWPLFSHWQSGAGQEQFQLFSPLEVFFPGNEKVRAAWSPLFALARHEQTAPGEERTSLLWNAVTWRRSDARREREFHLGPLFSTSRRGDERAVSIGNGLVSFRREPGSPWRILWLDFPSRSTPAATQPR